MILHNFIVFEGIDGSGTSTQLGILKKKLGDKIFATAEPTELPTGLFLRRMLKGEFPVDERTAAFLFAADRCEHIYGKGGITEHVQNGKIAVRSSLRQKQVHQFSLHQLHLLRQRIQTQRQLLWIRVVRSKLDQIRSAMILIAKKKVQENNKRIEAVKIK